MINKFTDFLNFLLQIGDTLIQIKQFNLKITACKMVTITKPMMVAVILIIINIFNEYNIFLTDCKCTFIVHNHFSSVQTEFEIEVLSTYHRYNSKGILTHTQAG